jgi:hypothetical protein
MIDRLRAIYLRLDNRSLALGRIVLGVVLIVDLLRRVPLIRDFYSNLGLLPNHTVLWRPLAPRMFSFWFMASLPEESALWFVVAFVCFLCFTVGYRTRLFQVLSFALTVSLHERILYAENWGTVVLAELLVWTLFLPLGRRFSVDALRASLRSRPDETPEDLAAGPPSPRWPRPRWGGRRDERALGPPCSRCRCSRSPGRSREACPGTPRRSR